MVPDVFVDCRAARPIADVVERLRILEAVSLAQGATPGEEKLADVIAVGRDVVVAEEREPLAAPGQLVPEPRAVISRRPFGPVCPVWRR